MVFFDLFRRRRQRRDRITITEEAVARMRPDGVEEKVRWDELKEVGIVTTDEGPTQEDLFWLLLAVNGTGCAIPQGADGAKELLGWLQRKLPGFDNEAVIQAMGSTSNANFTCWRLQAN